MRPLNQSQSSFAKKSSQMIAPTKTYCCVFLRTGPHGTFQRWWFDRNRFQGGRLMPIPPFDGLLAECRQAQVTHTQGMPCVYFLRLHTGIPAIDPSREEIDRFDWRGHLSLWSDEDANLSIFHVGTTKEDAASSWLPALVDIAGRVGANLPLAVKDQLRLCGPSSAFAWWAAFVWAYYDLAPHYFSPATAWLSPFEKTTLAIERCELLKLTGGEEEEGDWSEWETLAELARIYSGKTTTAKDFRGRAYEKQLKGYGLKKLGRKYRVRLDTMPEKYRKRFESKG